MQNPAVNRHAQLPEVNSGQMSGHPNALLPSRKSCLGSPPPSGSKLCLDTKFNKSQGCVSYVRNNTFIVLYRWMSHYG